MTQRIEAYPPKTVTQSALQLSELCCSYPDRPDVLQQVSLEIKPGERVGLIGPNGAGKTTLFLAICGVLPPKQGDITSFGKAVRTGEFRPEIGLLFQNPTDQLFSMSVRDDVAFGPMNMGLSELDVQERVSAVLELTGISDLADCPPHHLSGGQKQMVAIAAILAMRPRIMLYDEPSASLDIRARRRLIQFLQQCQETLLISAHDLEFILEVCDRVILLDEGRVVADGTAQAIMGNQDLMEAHGLEKPYSLIS